MNLKELVSLAVDQLVPIYDEGEAKNVVNTLLTDAHGVTRLDVLLDEPSELDGSAFQLNLQRLLNHEPVQYITGVAHFYGREFKVNRDVLIPRPETEELVDWIIQENKIDTPVIWDIGAGSGCISLTLANEIPHSRVFAIDVSLEALEIVRENSEMMGAGVGLINVDVLKETPQLPKPDILVSNPPYIPLHDRPAMSKNVLDYEPEVALFVSNEDPLIFYRRIAEMGVKRLNSGGLLYFEIHESTGNAVSTLLEHLGYSDIELRNDMQGKCRMVRGRINPD